MAKSDSAKNLTKKLAESDSLTRDQATLYSNAVRLSWGTEGIKSWTQQRSLSQLDDAVRLLEAAEAHTEAAEIPRALDSYRRAGDILEWLSRSDHIEDEIPVSLLAAATFCLADCPAMALGILSKEKIQKEAPIFSSFLRADFDGVLEHVLNFWSQNMELCGPSSSELKAPAQKTGETHNYLVIETVRTLGLLSSCIKTNNQERFDLAQSKLLGLSKLSLRISSPYSWLLFKLTCDVAKKFSEKSIWNVIIPINSHLSESGKQFSKSYCKGLFLHKQGILWPSQESGLNRLAENTSFAMCTPTGSGKTTIAEVAIVQASFSNEANLGEEQSTSPALSLYIVPSRALAVEVESRLARTIGRSRAGVSVVGLYGGSDLSLSDVWLQEKPTVLVCTVEKAEAILRYVGGILVSRLSLIIVDEAHQVNLTDSSIPDDLPKSENRAARLESFIARLRLQKPECKIIGLSAVAGGAENLISHWLSKDESSEPVGAKYRSTRQLIGALECHANGKTRARLEVLNGKKLKLSASNQEAYIPISFPDLPKVTGPLKSQIYSFVECHVLWMAIHLSLAKKKVLISVTQSIDSILNHYCSLFEEQAAWKRNCPTFFGQPRNDVDSGVYFKCLEACADYCGEQSFEYRLLKTGIAVHHGQLPTKVRRLMTEVIRKGITPITIATSTLTEGVNLPFDVILLPKIRRSRPDPDSDKFVWSNIPASEFLNLVGRAGRPGTQAEGMTLIALPMDSTSREGTQSARTHRRQIRESENHLKGLIKEITDQATDENQSGSPIAKLLTLIYERWKIVSNSDNLSDFEHWLETINPSAEDTEQNTLTDAVDTLDQVLLSAIEEAEAISQGDLELSDIESRLNSLWEVTYARFASKATDHLMATFVKRGSAVFTNIFPDRSDRKAIYHVCLPPRHAKRLLAIIPQIEAHLKSANDFNAWSKRDRFVYFFKLIRIIQVHPFFKIENLESHDWRHIFAWWMKSNKPENGPSPSETNDWLRYCSSMFEFKLGSAIGATLTTVWNRANPDFFSPVDLSEWSNITEMPWAAFWTKELLTWGTLEPLAAYLLAIGRVDSRIAAESYVKSYNLWASDQEEITNENEKLNPKHFRSWMEAEFDQGLDRVEAKAQIISVRLKRNFEESNQRTFSVMPKKKGNFIHWFDPAGFLLADSDMDDVWSNYSHFNYSFTLNVDRLTVERNYILSITG